MRYCLLTHYQEGSEIGLTEQDMAPAHLVAAAGRTEGAVSAYRRAIALTTEPAVVDYLLRRLHDASG